MIVLFGIRLFSGHFYFALTYIIMVPVLSGGAPSVIISIGTSRVFPCFLIFVGVGVDAFLIKKINAAIDSSTNMVTRYTNLFIK